MIKCCYLLKIKTKGHKINILIQIKGIGGYPFITRFKTGKEGADIPGLFSIGGYPFITRFKTHYNFHFLIIFQALYWRLSIYNKV